MRAKYCDPPIILQNNMGSENGDESLSLSLCDGQEGVPILFAWDISAFSKRSLIYLL